MKASLVTMECVIIDKLVLTRKSLTSSDLLLIQIFYVHVISPFRAPFRRKTGMQCNGKESI